ncbi:C-GCAxxG-C-C family protein [Carboxydochorda subterranea]|uniref:C-GCAxxG-C-C family protein n=1 Tax=Carboxydichorda subterranea TaxID=3109565 RepID=A0ABZ1BWR4_9FIRM|nr:C-GCAxxG-C-C family protein [Limnochorda sp. L945t]WRP17222.1 C-GCAxxG-C-C family protein [Limnochorda sp. L945t]
MAQSEGRGAGVSRRDLLATTGGFAGGFVLGALFAGKGLPPSRAAAGDVPEWPWPYTKLDPDAVAVKAHQAFYEGGCHYAVAKAVLSELREKVGYPYTVLPYDMFRYGEGGVVGWGSLCGALNGAGVVINLVSAKPAYQQLTNEVVGWYTQAEIPHYVPQGKEPMPTSVAGSPLCHVSVSKWATASGMGAESKERAERCARLCADVARRTVELLNSKQDGTFKAAFTPAAGIKDCLSCHGKEDLNNVREIKMNCIQCHEPHT